jgi:DNA-binding NarL/FixJ family response regulator
VGDGADGISALLAKLVLWFHPSEMHQERHFAEANGGLAMKAVSKPNARSSEIAGELARTQETVPSKKLRLYVVNATLLEKLLFVALQQTGLEVCEMWRPEKPKARKTESPTHENRSEILVMSSSGAVQDELRRIREIKAAIPGVKILLLLAATLSESELLQYLRTGISGLLSAEATAEEVVSAARAVNNGKGICSGKQCAILFRYFEKEAEAFPSAALRRDLGLTRREQQLIPFLTRGLTNKEIANHFSLSEQTVKNHLYRMKRKVGAHGRLEIADVCRQHGFPA